MEKYGNINRPIIIELTNTAGKRHISNNLKNLISYNENRKKLNQSMVYITDHLPKLLQESKLLIPYFKSKSLKQKPPKEQKSAITSSMLIMSE